MLYLIDGIFSLKRAQQLISAGAIYATKTGKTKFVAQVVVRIKKAKWLRSSRCPHGYMCVTNLAGGSVHCSLMFKKSPHKVCSGGFKGPS